MKNKTKKFTSLSDLNALKQQLQEKEMQEITQKNPVKINVSDMILSGKITVEHSTP